MFEVRPLHRRPDANAEMSRQGGGALPPPFRDAAGNWLGHEWSRWRTDLLDERVDELLAAADDRGRAILDLGCATGARAEQFAGRGHRVTGVDLIDHTAEIAERNSRLHSSAMDGRGSPIAFHCADIRDLPASLRARRFDLVHARRLINFLSEDALDAFLAVVKRALGDSGLFVASFIATGLGPAEIRSRVQPADQPSTPLAPGVRAHPFGAVHHLLCEHGFAILEVFSDGQIEAGFIASPSPVRTGEGVAATP